MTLASERNTAKLRYHKAPNKVLNIREIRKRGKLIMRKEKNKKWNSSFPTMPQFSLKKNRFEIKPKKKKEKKGVIIARGSTSKAVLERGGPGWIILSSVKVALAAIVALAWHVKGTQPNLEYTKASKKYA